jgi:hypothetical protein
MHDAWQPVHAARVEVGRPDHPSPDGVNP